MKQKSRKMLLAGGIASTVGISYMYQQCRLKRAEKTDGTGKTVLITGASGGIGKAFAFVFASYHFNLVLVARNQEKLEELKLELENSYPVEVTVIPKDLSDEHAAEELYEEVKEKGIVIDQLVNNAGAGKQSRVTDADKETLYGLIHLNVSTVTMLCRLFGHDMVSRGNGRILKVSSMGAFIPDPWFNVYGPTKAYEMFLTEAMYGELKGSGVTVSVLCPGPVKTNWAANAGKADSRIAKRPEAVAEAGFLGLQAGQLVIVPSADYRAFREIMKFLPYKIQTDIIAVWQKTLINKT